MTVLKNPFKRQPKIKQAQEGTFKVKSVMLGRKKKVLGDYPCFISLFSTSKPHLNVKGPDKMFEFEDVECVHVHGLISHYLPRGNDIVIDDLESIMIKQKGSSLYVSGKQKTPKNSPKNIM